MVLMLRVFIQEFDFCAYLPIFADLFVSSLVVIIFNNLTEKSVAKFVIDFIYCFYSLWF